MPDALALIAATLRRLAARPDLVVTPETRLAGLGDLDSLRLLEAIALVEMELRVEIDTARLDRLDTVADLLAALEAAAPR